ncbi:MAG: peptide-methionine (S)-S-oxide reductase MsrA [Agarilytica sp.]
MRVLLILFLCLFSQLSLAASAVFAGGCFWCMEPPFDKLEGVTATISGYSGGNESDADYKSVSAGKTAHVEVIKVEYDPEKINYETLLEVFWRNVDPFDGQGQFCDKGAQYKSYVYFANEKERLAALASLDEVKKQLQASGKVIATELRERTPFYSAEAYHQDYYQKNPIRYKFYRTRCGRDARLKAVWGK